MRFFRHCVIGALILGALAAAPTSAQSATPDRAGYAHPYGAHVAEGARRFGIPEAWIWAVMRVESGGNRGAVSRAGAMSLMQIMPDTWAELSARHGLGSDPFDARANILAGAAYLRQMYDRYGDVSAMLAAYNAGPGRYDDYRRGRPLPAETRAYLVRLASITGSDSVVQHAAAPPPDPFAWRRATLFVRTASAADPMPRARSDGAIAATSTTADEEPVSASPDREAISSARDATARDTLFVPRAGAGRPQ